MVTGDVVNDLSALLDDPNVTIHDAKVFVGRVERAGGRNAQAGG
jgi:formate dehydrogenase major subunit